MQIRSTSIMTLGLLLLSGCGDNDRQLAVPVTVTAVARPVVEACGPLGLTAAIGGSVRRVWWDSPDDPLWHLAHDGRSGSEGRAPSVVVETPLRLRLNATDSAGVTHSDTVDVLVTPAARTPELADGMAWDCAPFRHGVASGDPLPDGVRLWTRVTPSVATEGIAVTWEVAEEPAFLNVVASGRTTAREADDFTVQVDGTGLEPGHTYYYRFTDPAGVRSVTGRTRTAPRGSVAQLRFAVASCSSIYSGYFNAYRRIAERDDLDLMIHLGDYLYDFVDPDEKVRVPEPYPSEPTTLQEWRDRHAYYLADPDLRLARARHPWMLLWDNHDVNANAPAYGGGVQAFLEWNPMRVGDLARPEITYRVARYGDLVDLVLMDALLHRNRDRVPGSDAFSILGDEQFAWLEPQLRASSAAWRVIGNQRILGTVRINPTYAALVSGERRDVFDTGAWDGFAADRTRLLSLLTDAGIDDNIVVSGDSHVSVALDLADQPLTPESPSAGVELLATSISRGNFDETLSGFGFPAELQQSTLNAILNDTRRRNPHHSYLELTKHGYGTLDITAERVVAQFWYSEILQRTDHEEPGPAFTVQRGANRWSR